MSKADLQQLLSNVKTIALVGISKKTDRPSYEVMHFLQQKGFKIYPVNPILSGETILNETVYSSLNELPVKVDMVDIFRNSEAAGETSEEVLQLNSDKRPNIVWMQIGVINEEAAIKLRREGLTVVMNECPKQALN